MPGRTHTGALLYVDLEMSILFRNVTMIKSFDVRFHKQSLGEFSDVLSSMGGWSGADLRAECRRSSIHSMTFHLGLYYRVHMPFRAPSLLWGVQLSRTPSRALLCGASASPRKLGQFRVLSFESTKMAEYREWSHADLVKRVMDLEAQLRSRTKVTSYAHLEHSPH